MWIKFLAQGNNTCSQWGSNPVLLDLESDALPLHHKSFTLNRLIMICYTVAWWPSLLSDQIVFIVEILNLHISGASHHISAQSDLLIGRRCALKNFKTATIGHLGYWNRTILANLNLHNTLSYSLVVRADKENEDSFISRF